MINEQAIDSYNHRLTANLGDIPKLTASQRDAVKAHGTRAENLLSNKDVAMFVHQAKFDIMDQLSSIRGYTEEDNIRRVALSNQLAGIDSFITGLQRAVYMKNRVVNPASEGPTRDPALHNPAKEVFKP
jgi:hypothetical protein